MKLLLLIITSLISNGLYADVNLPIYDKQIHTGVGSCANSVCHGAVIPHIKSNISHDEYTTWIRKDPHSQTYNKLFSAEYISITQKLGLKKPHKEETCLVCHASNVAQKFKGRRFSIQDGVACETCHGGAEDYISTHTDKNATREKNILNGMYPTDNMVQRIRLCLSCHYGTTDQFVSHEIMGAGHPRMSFEMDTFTALLTAHYKLDKDYRKRKSVYSNVKMWALGQAIAAESMLKMLDKNHLYNAGLFPELSLFDCHSCHHAMSEKSWKKRKSINLKPGSVPLNDSSLIMLRLILKSVNVELYIRLRNNLKALHLATINNPQNIIKIRDDIINIVEQSISLINGYDFSMSDIEYYTKQLINEGLAGEYQDYISAEQCVMAIAALTASWNNLQAFDEATSMQLNQLMNQLYMSVENDESFDPLKLSTSLKKLKIGLFPVH